MFVFFSCRAANLYVSMNDGLSFISSSVTITSLSCVSQHTRPTMNSRSKRKASTVYFGSANNIVAKHFNWFTLKSSDSWKTKPKEYFLCTVHEEVVYMCLTVSVVVWWDSPGHSVALPHAAAGLGFALVVLASLLHCGEFSQGLFFFFPFSIFRSSIKLF